jgi:hypothetical protein
MSSENYVKGIPVKMLSPKLRDQVRRAAARGHSKIFIRILVKYLRWGFGLSVAFAKTKQKVPV